jgi:hypothetical protein
MDQKTVFVELLLIDFSLNRVILSSTHAIGLFDHILFL